MENKNLKHRTFNIETIQDLQLKDLLSHLEGVRLLHKSFCDTLGADAKDCVKCPLTKDKEYFTDCNHLGEAVDKVIANLRNYFMTKIQLPVIIQLDNGKRYRLVDTGKPYDEVSNNPSSYPNCDKSFELTGVLIEMESYGLPDRPPVWVSVTECENLESALRTINLFNRRPYDSDIDWIKEKIMEK